MVFERSDELAPGPLRLGPEPRGGSWVRRRAHLLLWLGALSVFVLGSWIGWNVNANVGALLWLASAILGFLPFLSHRHDDKALRERRSR